MWHTAQTCARTDTDAPARCRSHAALHLQLGLVPVVASGPLLSTAAVLPPPAPPVRFGVLWGDSGGRGETMAMEVEDLGTERERRVAGWPPGVVVNDGIAPLEVATAATTVRVAVATMATVEIEDQ
jgi:hypothetical protein